jgi:uncharacterized flavoprotein (TIGR03862 family)
MADPNVAVIGAGPAGLIAAEVLSRAGLAVTVYDRMPSPGRKFLMAGRGGLNLTHSEPFARVVERYGAASGRLRPMLEAFSPSALTTWAEELGQPTFIGSSGRIFPKALKASPLLRAWLARLATQGVSFRTRAAWTGWDGDGALTFDTPEGRLTAEADAAVLALGGASWPRLGADGGWTGILAAAGVPLTPFRPANSGFDVAWSAAFRDRFAGAPLKNVGLAFGGHAVRGEMTITGYGVEGGAVYALSAELRDALDRDGGAELGVDLRPDMTAAQVAARLARVRAGESLANGLRKALALSPAAVNLLREAHGPALPREPEALAAAIKAAPLRLTAMQGLERAISTAGGVAWDAVDEALMLKARPGVFVAGEMLDWEAPTGGYLLQACFATGMRAARGVLARLG